MELKFNVIVIHDINKIYIECNSNITVGVFIYDDNTKLYYNIANFTKNRFWYSLNKQLKDIENLRIEIVKDGDIIYEFLENK